MWTTLSVTIKGDELWQRSIALVYYDKL